MPIFCKKMCCTCCSCDGYYGHSYDYDWDWCCDVEEYHCYSFCFPCPCPPKVSPAVIKPMITLPALPWPPICKPKKRPPAPKPNSMIEKYSPVFSVDYDNVFNESTQQYDTDVRRILKRSYSECGHDQVEISIYCARQTAQIVNSFADEFSERGWKFSVSIATETQVRKSDWENKRIPLRPDDPSYGYIENPKQEKYTWMAPALTEKYFPDTVVMFCNTGWVNEERKGIPQKLLLALPHYSFEWTSHQYMIGSLQASIDHRDKMITIMAPTLMSTEGNLYGCEDIGITGIQNFFYWNPSNSLVPNFTRPQNTQSHYQREPRNLAQCRGR